MKKIWHHDCTFLDVTRCLKKSFSGKDLLYGLFSCLFSFSYIIGRRVGADPNFLIRDKDVLYFFICAIGSFAVLRLFLLGIDVFSPSNVDVSSKSRKSFILVFWLTFIACWSVYLWILRPALLSPDSVSVVGQALGLYGLSDHHPILYTAILSVFVNIGKMVGSINLGISLISVFQMSIGALVLSMVLNWMYHETNSLLVIWIVAFYALHPIYPIAMMCIWKDILFSIGVFAFSIYVLYVTNHEGKNLNNKLGLIALFCFGGWLISLRHNGVFVYAGTMILLFVILRNRITLKKAWFVTVFCLVLFVGGKKIVMNGLNISPGRFVESVGVPLNQMGAVIANDGELTNETEVYLNELLPLEIWKEKYDAGWVDPIKFSPEFNHEKLGSSKREFFITS